MNKLETPKEAGVIVMHDLTTDSLVLTQRSTEMPEHPGEICFPGGRWQEGDDNLYATALRELREELDIDSSRIQLQRSMALERTLTGYIIQPWLVTIESIDPYKANLAEVSAVFSLPLAEVSNLSNYQEVTVKRYGVDIKSYQYMASTYFVWGATARIMMQLSKKRVME
ncbi:MULTISPECIES: NUDIX hydrolase [unclassified Legionella]|uniref:NUDIX hydrolase n=1 Tax=unclassified Legionella TaxID=2622702 RepID=UPI001E555CDD|nr:CoA pyrophosphatase [Legionella sp. 31fI33]